ncbi:MAG: hypothetical protein HY001_00965 [Candidatus Portnoybacteria bacterium]|nr:hypothetical protein [Candidatus Portnoybacteria bacterium]
MSDTIQKIARILRTNPETLTMMVGAMERITSKTGVLEDILLENETNIRKALGILGVTSRSAEEIAKAFEDLLERNDRSLFEILGKPSLSHPEQAYTLIGKAWEAVGAKTRGLFLKKEKAREFLTKTPPPAIMRGLGYSTASELLEHERLQEVFAALRFIETRDWMNKIFVQNYKNLTPQDFEERPIEVFILQQKWLSLAQKFLEKKYHNVSHLKELGVVFIIPITLDTPGETLRLFSLLLHYLYEVAFYARLISEYAKHPESFSSKLVSLIRGDVGEASSQFADSFARWLIVQRYLAKDDEADPRLFLPHVNPEAIHWRKAQLALARFGAARPSLALGMFADLDYVGGFFPSKKVGELLVSFDLVDNVMSLTKRESMVKYLYHHQEALWNRIFTGFMGEERIEELILENLDRGYIELTL